MYEPVVYIHDEIKIFMKDVTTLNVNTVTEL